MQKPQRPPRKRKEYFVERFWSVGSEVDAASIDGAMIQWCREGFWGEGSNVGAASRVYQMIEVVRGRILERGFGSGCREY
jgi:hypothetical protein